MPNYVSFKHKESNLTVTCHQVDKILLNHFNVLHKDDPEEWYCNWYNDFAPLLAAGRSIESIISLYVNGSTKDDLITERIGKALDKLFTINCGYTH